MKRKAFTIIEVLVTLAILAVLAAIFILAIQQARETARKAANPSATVTAAGAIGRFQCVKTWIFAMNTRYSHTDELHCYVALKANGKIEVMELQNQEQFGQFEDGRWYDVSCRISLL